MKVFDLHNDVLTAATTETARQYLIGGLRNELCGIVAAAWSTETAIQSSEALENAYMSVSDISGVCLGIEDLGSFTDFSFLGKLPVKYASLTWNHQNRLASGAHSDGGLTKEGARMIARLNREKILLDTAHLNEKSFFSAVDAASGVICSHTCANALCSNRRNLTDRQIKLIASRGGVVGVCLVGSFLTGGAASSLDVVRHIDHIVQLCGIDYIAIGTDYFGTDDLPSDIKDYKSFAIIVEKLQKLGYNEGEINQILNGNALRVFAQGG